MYTDRNTHNQFLEDELRAQTDSFGQKLDSKASYLRDEKGELFAAQFVKFESGEMILKFSNKHDVPRKGEYLYCFTVPKELRNPLNWCNLTYGDLVKRKGTFSEVVCLWQAPVKDNPDFCFAGFRGIDVEFAESISGGEGMIVLLGPNKPPFEYISNLQKIVKYKHHESINAILDGTYEDKLVTPNTLKDNVDILKFVLSQLELTDSLILQGPPGTGKTYQIATICKKICNNGGSVLVTALTNRALIEVAEKEELKDLLVDGKIHKTKLTVDESKELPDLRCLKQITAEPGHVVLSTFYITSSEAANTIGEAPFDFVIMDEASQALLGMFAAAKLLGKKCIYVGDTNQLSPVISINEDKVSKRNYSVYVDGLVTISQVGAIPSYRLVQTRRLPQRAAEFTGIFYEGTLISLADKNIKLSFPNMQNPIGRLFHPQGGPTLLKTDSQLGDKKPLPALALATMLVSALLSQKEKLHVSVLSFYVETTKALQRAIYQTIGNHNNLLIDTVSRIQGLTTDVAIFVIPNSGYNWSLNRRLFNVATSRARRHTIIISDVGILSHVQFVDKDVIEYLTRLDKCAFYIPIKKETQLALTYANENQNEQQPIELQVLQDVPAEEHIVEENTVTVQNDAIEDKPEEKTTFIKTEAPKINLKVVGKIDLSRFESKKTSSVQQADCYIIDTNVFVECPDIINRIDKHAMIILSAKVVDELDKLKITLGDEDKKSVQSALRLINKAMDVREFEFSVADMRNLPRDFDRRSPDNMILSVALRYKENNPVLLTSDNGLQIKAKGLGIQVVSLKSFLKK